jgi:hypothetical protein
MQIRIFIIIGLAFVLFYNCSKDKNDSPSLNADQDKIQEMVLNLHKKCYNLWIELKPEMDSVDALDFYYTGQTTCGLFTKLY